MEKSRRRRVCPGPDNARDHERCCSLHSMIPTYALGGYREYAAPPDLHGVVENTWLYVGPEVEAAHRVLPDLTVTIALRCDRAAGGTIADAAITFTGPTDA